MECLGTHLREGVRIRGVLTPCKIIIAREAVMVRFVWGLIGSVIAGRRAVREGYGCPFSGLSSIGIVFLNGWRSVSVSWVAAPSSMGAPSKVSRLWSLGVRSLGARIRSMGNKVRHLEDWH